MFRRAAIGVLMVAAIGALPLSTGSAQSQAAFTESRMISETVGQQPETTLVSTVHAGLHVRSTLARSGGHPAQSALLGNVQLISVSDSGVVIAYMDTVRHTYTELNTTKLFASHPLDVKLQDAKGDSATLDSIGAGETVMGYPTVHYRGSFTMNISVRVLDQNVSSKATTVTDYYVASGVFLSPAADSGARRDASVSAMAVPSLMGQAAKTLSAVTARMAKVGTTVKSVAHVSMSGDAGSKEIIQTYELLSYHNETAPDSLFRIPPGYTNTTPAIFRRP